MKNFKCIIYLPLVIVLVSLILDPTFAHPKPKVPKNCPPPPPKAPRKKSPPLPPKDLPPPQEPKQDPPPPQEPKQDPPPPQEPKQDPPPPQEPKQEPPPPQEPKQEPPPPQEPKQEPPPPQEPKQDMPPPQDNKQSPPQPPPDEPQKPTPFHNRFKGIFTAVFAFGDSYTDTGNAQFLGSLSLSFSGSLSSPYGSTTFGKRSNRLSDGRLVIDFITDSLGLPVLPPYQATLSNITTSVTTGVNFAIAGATTLANDLFSKLTRIFLWKGTPLGIMTELEWYKKYQVEQLCKGLDQKACAEKLKTVLFWVGEIGLNDFSRAVGSKIPLKSIAKSSVTYTSELVRTLIRNGAKNIVVQGLPPLGCLPLDISLTPLSLRDRSGCSQIVNAAVIIHNQILQAKLELYRKLFPDVTIIYADSWKAFYAIRNNPEKYKIQEVNRTCCGSTTKQDDMNFNLQSLCGSSGTSICNDPSQYISWDGIHPTESMNYHMTDQYINHGCCHPPFEELMKKDAPKKDAPKKDAPKKDAPK